MYLNLAGNKLRGSVPIPSRKNMYFDLSQNELSGRIPFQVGERLSNARYASLSSNQLSGEIPITFCSNKGLELNSFNLGSLDLSNNSLTGSIPSSLGNCSGLIFLHLGINNLSGQLPNELAQVTRIMYLLLHDNILEGTFPKIIQEFKRLNVLTLGNNNFRGNIPTFIGSFLHLRILSLRSNAFNGSIPKEISNLGKLQILDLSFNSLSGPIHGKTIGNLTMLTTRPNDISAAWGGGMFISDLQLQIVVKGVLHHINRLQGFNSGVDLSCNKLEGDIPEDIGLLKGLSMLNLSNNHFNGNIPSSVGNMTGLESLDLSFNNLSGEIPMELVSLSYLGYINLSYNNLSGRIPENAHFQSLSLDGSAFLGNEFLCGVPTRNHCDGNPVSPTSSKTSDNTNLHVEDDEDGAREKVFLFGSVVLGVGVGFWGLFLGLLCRKEKWLFGYWRVVDNIAGKVGGCMKKNA
ncbi:hypothetical protein MKW92_006693 [Papaver armeniacum]|nr:hypothetical protein MKW92_006693 [Papaver armeniacum]